MVICFACSADTKRKIDALVGSKKYRDASELITVAVDNLVVLHGEVEDRGAAVFAGEAATPYPVTAAAPAAAKRPPNVAARAAPVIPALFSLDGIPATPPFPLAPLPVDQFTPGQPVTLDRWLFGQYNKLLPAKASCRALARMLLDSPDGVPLSHAAATISEQAAALGDYLIQLDSDAGTKRDNALATAFPVSGPEGQKGRVRYANQFVAHVNKEGKVFGLLVDLKLVGTTSGKEPRLLLTDPGWRLAVMGNPVLEASGPGRFSQEETAFLLAHIAGRVPVEHFAYRTVLKAVVDGATTPDNLESALRKNAPPNDAELSPAFFATQRSGAVSRMMDLALLERRRKGVRVSYSVTDFGKRFNVRAIGNGN